MRPGPSVSLGVVSGALIGMCCFSSGCDQNEKTAQLHQPPNHLDVVRDVVKDCEGELREFASKILNGGVLPERGMISYPPPTLKRGGSMIICATRDKNGNVYFRFSESSVTENVGAVLKRGELLGDGSEPRISTQVWLYGDWWYYRSH